MGTTQKKMMLSMFAMAAMMEAGNSDIYEFTCNSNYAPRYFDKRSGGGGSGSTKCMVSPREHKHKKVRRRLQKASRITSRNTAKH